MNSVPTQTQLILDALEAAQRSLDMVKKLIGNSLAGGLGGGVTGVFDGEFMVTDEGKRYQVPPNYASKSLLVVGDTLRLVPGDTALNEPNKFKQIEKIERLEVEAVVTKKDGRWAVICDLGSFFVLPAAIKFFNVNLNQKVIVSLPKDYKNLKAQWATIKGIESEEATQAPVISSPPPPVVDNAKKETEAEREETKTKTVKEPPLHHRVVTPKSEIVPPRPPREASKNPVAPVKGEIKIEPVSKPTVVEKSTPVVKELEAADESELR